MVKHIHIHVGKKTADAINTSIIVVNNSVSKAKQILSEIRSIKNDDLREAEDVEGDLKEVIQLLNRALQAVSKIG